MIVRSVQNRRRAVRAGARDCAVPLVDSCACGSDLVSPLKPSSPRMSREHLEVRAGAALLDNVVNLVRLARVLALAGDNDVGLGTAGTERPVVLASDPEKTYLG